MKILFISVCTVLLLMSKTVTAQTENKPRGLTAQEYTDAKTYNIKDIDNDIYAKFGNNQYIVERYEEKKPYFITGDDGKRKRIDLYALTKKGEDFPLATIVYYTTESGKRYTACLPNQFTDGKIWERYFEDIHAINNVEANYVLKLSYVLSKEFSFQVYKATLKGEAVDRSEAGTYGNDICFPGTNMIEMADGSRKMLQDIKAGDKVLVVDSVTKQQRVTAVKKLIRHDAANYTITSLTLLNTTTLSNDHDVRISVQQIKATPNHPIQTQTGVKKIGAVTINDEVLCTNQVTGAISPYRVWLKQEKAGGKQTIYNIETHDASEVIINGVVVKQK